MQNYKTDQSTMNCFYLMSKRSKQLKTTNAIKLRSICIDLTSKRSKTFELRRKSRKVIKTPKCIMHSIDLTSNRSKKLSYVPKLQRNQITMDCIDLTSNNPKCWDTSQNIHNNAKLLKWSNYNASHRFDVKTI